MSTTLEPQKPKVTAPAPDEQATLIDTSKMNAGQRAALEMTEAARETASERGSFGSELFMGRLTLNRLFPFPEQSVEDRAAGDAFLQKLAPLLREHVDPDEIDRTGEISAFALTESGVGSDPATLVTHAEPTPDGKHFILNGEKLWYTNGVKAGIIVVMAKTPPKMVNGKERKQVTAFIVEMNMPGVE